MLVTHYVNIRARDYDSTEIEFMSNKAHAGSIIHEVLSNYKGRRFFVVFLNLAESRDEELSGFKRDGSCYYYAETPEIIPSPFEFSFVPEPKYTDNTIPVPKGILEALEVGRKATEKAIEEEKKRQDEVRNLLFLEYEKVNYRKLLLMALLKHYEDETQCWSGEWEDGDYGLPALTEKEKAEIDDIVVNYVRNGKLVK